MLWGMPTFPGVGVHACDYGFFCHMLQSLSHIAARWRLLLSHFLSCYHGIAVHFAQVVARRGE
jgi:hypothetical protein